MNIEKYLSGKTIMVTGGTGSFGNQIVSQLLQMNVSKIVIVSRDEKKQYDMSNKFSKFEKELKFEIADVRDYARLSQVMKGSDIVFHAAALKQVPHCEFNPFEAVKTNIVGAENVRRAAISNGIKRVVAVSTDKAVKPVNVMGMTKAIQERILLSPENNESGTSFICVRYGNVLGSRGSVVPFFKELLKNKTPLPVTHPEMTRFMLTLPEAISLVFKATIEGKHGELFVKKMPACKIIDLARVMARRLANSEDYPIYISGVRPGEKIHEILVSEEEMRRSTELKDHYLIHPQGYLGKSPEEKPSFEYTSQNTHQMNVNEIENLLEMDNWLSYEHISEEL